MKDANDDALWVHRLIDAARRGVVLDLQAGAPATQYNPSTAHEWPLDRSIPASAIRTVMSEVMRGEHPDLDPRGLRIQGARITGPADFTHITFSYPLHFSRCYVDELLDLGYTKLGALLLSKSHLHSLSLYGSTISGDVDADDITTTGEFNALGATIEGHLLLDGAALYNPGQHALTLHLTKIIGTVTAQRITTHGEIHAQAVSIGSTFILNDAVLDNPSHRADQHVLLLDGATITGDLHAERITTHGHIRAVNATIGGQLNLHGAGLHNPGKDVLTIEGASITGHAVADQLTTYGGIEAFGAHFGSLLSLNSAFLHHPPHGPGQHVLNIDGATITGGIFADDLATHGEIHAISANIGGQFKLNGANLRNPSRDALVLNNATVTGGIFADELDVNGRILAVGTNIGGPVILNGADLRNPSQTLILLNGATIRGEVVTIGLRAQGFISASAALFESSLDLAYVEQPSRNTPHLRVQLKTATIKRLVLPVGSIHSLDLSGSKIELLVTPLGTEPKYRVNATGWTLGDVEGKIRTDHKAATRWLSPDSNAWLVEGDSPQPWHALAAVYERNGHPAEARRLRFTAANNVTKTAPPTTKLMRWGYRLVAGHGYYPLLAALWLLLVLAGGITLIDMNRQHFVPNTIGAATTITTSAAEGPTDTTITGADDCSTHPKYPCLDSFTYALTGVIPAAAGITRPDWAVSSTAPVTVKLGLPALRILAWIFTAILLAGVTGLLRKSS
ncbi:hypothetical protein [Rhodococcus sp. WY5]|uniref:hypothetical protein n=1 Tax=Rhodococcus sp. WY5 TaxID=2708349 RepID=UPI001BDE14D9|nr:hypothetical protein [Rhodococcus sp. WY5]